MATIEDVMKLVGVKKVFTKEGYFTKEAERKYDNVIQLIYALEELGVIPKCDGDDLWDEVCDQEDCIKPE